MMNMQIDIKYNYKEGIKLVHFLNKSLSNYGISPSDIDELVYNFCKSHNVRGKIKDIEYTWEDEKISIFL